jgi:hypothetical protein
MSLCVLPPFSRFYPPSPITHAQHTVLLTIIPPSSVHRMIHRSAATRPSLWPCISLHVEAMATQKKAKLCLWSALLFFGRRGRCERQPRR